MKCIYLCLLILFFCRNIHAQIGTIEKSITIENNLHPEKEAYYKESIYKANMEQYRLKDKNVTLHFSEGFDCVLLAAKALFSQGIKIDETLYPSDFDPKLEAPKFSLSPDGFLLALHTKHSK